MGVDLTNSVNICESSIFLCQICHVKSVKYTCNVVWCVEVCGQCILAVKTAIAAPVESLVGWNNKIYTSNWI